MERLLTPGVLVNHLLRLRAMGASSPDLFFGVSYLVQFWVGAIDAIEDLPNCVGLREDPLSGLASARRCRPWTSLGKSMKRRREAACVSLTSVPGALIET